MSAEEMLLEAIFKSDFTIEELEEIEAEDQRIAWEAHRRGAHRAATVMMIRAAMARQLLALKRKEEAKC
jgi:hypothetical protein